jgi:hypothetical protein
MKVPIYEEKDNGHTPIWMEEQRQHQATNDQGIQGSVWIPMDGAPSTK